MATLIKPNDAAWLYMEKSEMPTHIGCLAIFSLPPDAPSDFLLQLAARFRATRIFAPPFNYRLQRGALRRVLPAWEELTAEQIDLDYHFRHSALPQPGGERELGTLVSRLHSYPLDRRRPLWEVHLIEGLENRRFALYTKMHHSQVDGVGGARLIQGTMSPDPDARNCAPPWEGRKGDARRERPKAPPLRQILREQMDALVPAVKTLVAKPAVEHLDETARPFVAPMTPFNGRIHGKRRFATQNYELDRIKRVARAAGVTLNDVFMALCSGSLRRYLGELGQLPEASLTAGMPVSVRPAGDESVGNAISFILAQLHTEIADPRERLMACHASAQAAKQPLLQLPKAAINHYTMMLMTPQMLQVSLGLGGYTRPMYNLIISNVPGPAETLYLNGARLEQIYPISLLFNGQALNISVVSYGGRFNLGFTGCRDSLPSMQKIAVYTGEALEELERVLGIGAEKAA
ncbi:wax ester/triacylglycerol synthase family O-acyltransferase [Solimonas sp. K1W22B-7]|uniref:WS/DGAT/MGAT family O-acyltransferase n=1 Tax=Solimonas sp. K1W22B-7 TaxID=2303331 RepID=UPI000E33274A|nr:wax ester/triacylglycerol synthase family O-acyltransferase [Solimonas sp. K1W22B-7]AXQ28271.1 wax ester/triacylglycerol synthase family O-acyltransferase [Solimonas sp. K1W22B-7]